MENDLIRSVWFFDCCYQHMVRFSVCYVRFLDCCSYMAPLCKFETLLATLDEPSPVHTHPSSVGNHSNSNNSNRNSNIKHKHKHKHKHKTVEYRATGHPRMCSQYDWIANVTLYPMVGSRKIQRTPIGHL